MGICGSTCCDSKDKAKPAIESRIEVAVEIYEHEVIRKDEAVQYYNRKF